MPKFSVHAKTVIPQHYTVRLVINAQSPEEAKQEVKKMFDGDQIDWDDVDIGYESSELEILSVSEINPNSPSKE